MEIAAALPGAVREMLAATTISSIKSDGIPRTSGFATHEERDTSMTTILKKFGWWNAVLGLVLATMVLPMRVAAQDQYQQQDDPPSRVARIGYMEGSVSFQPAAEADWVKALPHRPMTTRHKIWANKDSRAELQLGSAG